MRGVCEDTTGNEVALVEYGERIWMVVPKNLSNCAFVNMLESVSNFSKCIRFGSYT